MSPLTFRPAKRENVSLLIGLAGGTGSGKTYSAMRLAKGLAGRKPFAVIDTEADRAKHYADQFTFDHASLGPPFRPQKYAEAIRAAAEQYSVILVDSMSHEWDGTGGMLEWHDELMDGKDTRKLSSWILPKTEHRKLVNELLQVRAHLILCFRAAKKVEMVKDPKTGKWEIVEKQSLTGLDGWIPICEKNLPFELTVSLLLTADQPGIPHPIKLQAQHRPFVPLSAPITEATGVALGQWAAGDERRPTPAEAEALDAEVNALIERALAVTPDEAKGTRHENIQAARAEFEPDLGAFLAWLGAQVERLEDDAAAAAQRELSL